MATDDPTASPAPERESETFDALDHRLLSMMSRLQCVVENFRDYTGLANELHPAAFFLQETAEDMVKFRGDLESWYMAHEHTPKAPKAVQS